MATVYYTLEEISKHNGTNGTDTWIVVKNNVYNVQPYLKLDEHPGGNELVEEWAGKICTKAFDEAGHSRDAKDQLKKYKIGEVAEEDRGKKPAKPKQEVVIQAKPEIVVTSERDINKLPPLKQSGLAKPEKSCIGIITCGLMG